MRAIIFLYSGTGNTALACRYIAEHLDRVEVEIADAVRDKVPDLSQYGLIGLATFTDFLLPPLIFRDFIKRLPDGGGKPAFVFNTFGLVSGKTLIRMADLARERGYTVVAGHSLHMPENYPPLISRGVKTENAPSDAEMGEFKDFAAGLNVLAARLSRGERVPAVKVDIGPGNKLMPKYPKGMGRRMMGPKSIDESRCTGCGDCVQICPNQAIAMAETPVFDEQKCTSCWACYNHCLARAIQAKKLGGGGLQYTGPSPELIDKFTRR